MASSQIELASSAPFGCVLRDHNRRERCRESTARAAQAAFHNNLKSLVRDHLSTCISSVTSSNPASNENNKPLDQIENVVDSWVGNKDESSIKSPRQARVLDRWAARQQGKETERQSQEAELMSLPNSAPSSSRTSTSMKEETLPRTDSLAKISNLGVGASSLVQIWEKRLNQSNKMSSNDNVTETSRSNSGLSEDENENENIFNSPIESNASNESTASNDPNPSNGSNLEKQPSRQFETGDFIFDERYDAGPVTEDCFEDSHSDGSAKSDCRSNLEAEREREKVRVSDIIKRLTGSQQCTLSSPSEVDNDHDQQQSCVNPPPCRDRDRERPFGFDHAEQLHKAFCHVISSPRMIRGRQAFADLLMHLERDRHRELDTLVDRRAVSKFSHKGRIQSMLKLKMLQRGMAMLRQDSLRRKPQGKLRQGSAIMHLREKFSSGVEQAQNDAGGARTLALKELEKNMRVVQVESSSSTNSPRESSSNGKFDVNEQRNTNTTLVQNPLLRTGEDLREEVSLSSEVALQGTSSVARESSLLANASEEASSCSKVTLQGTSSLARNESPRASNDHHDEASSSSSKVTLQESSLVVRNALTQASEYFHDEASSSSEVPSQETSTMAKNTLPHACEDVCEEMGKNSEEMWHGSTTVDRNLELQETVDTSTSLVGWDENEIEEEDDYQYYGNYSYDSWINEISRPRSYWEDLRKTWYQEMLNSNSGKGEIRQLIERRTVSNFLTSDFRDKIDRLMVSRIEIQTQQDCGEEEEDEDNTQDRLNQMVAFLQQQQQQQQRQQEQVQQQPQQKICQGSQEEEKQGLLQEKEQEHQQEEQDITEEEDDDEEDENDDEGEERSLISGQFQEASDDFDQFRSPSHMTAWSYQDNEVMGGDSDRAASISPPPRRCSPSPSYHHRRQCSPSPSPSYNQRHRHYSPSTSHPSIEVELIYDMRGQMEQLYHEMSELRKAIKSCVDMQMTMQQSMMKQEVHSGQSKSERAANGLAKKGNCCICREVKVDSLFYRCGHMCTCHKCAQELQWKSGKCPICRAPIVDVVKAYMEY